MRIVKASLDDLEDVVNLNKLFHLNVDGFKWDTPKWVRNEIKKRNYFVLKTGKEIIGAICLKLSKNQACIKTIAVRKTKQNSGLGRYMIGFAKEYTKRNGKTKLIVESFRDYNLTRFYEKCGFTKSLELGCFRNKPYYWFFMDL